MTGGYTIIDLGHTDFTTAAPVTVPGLYSKIEGSKKVILLEHFSVGGTDCRPIYPEIAVSGSNFTFDAYGHTFTVSDADAVTIVAKE